MRLLTIEYRCAAAHHLASGATADPLGVEARSTTMRTSARVAVLGTVVACASAAALAPQPAAQAASATTTVTLKDISFNKSTVKIARAGAVSWVWKDGPTPHNVTFSNKHSKTQKKGTYTLRFVKVGTYRYHCTIHPGMTGKVIVR